MAISKPNPQQIIRWLNARHARERVIILVAGLGIVGLLWLAFVHDALEAAKETVSRNITITNGRIQDEQSRQAQIRGSYTDDPNAFAVSRISELRNTTEQANSRLNQLYGELISPQRMAQVLTSILQNETALDFVSLVNVPSQALLTATATDAAAGAPEIQVFRHGMRMVFEGNFLDAVEYLRNLEQLDGNFFWENLEFELEDYPSARISLEIYTLSTEDRWIGV